MPDSGVARSPFRLPFSPAAEGEAQVLVVGAGIGGLSVALLFARAGAAVTVLEKVADPGEVGAGLLLQPNGLAVLSGLGLGAEVERQGRVVSSTELRAADGRVLLSSPIPDFGGGLDHLVAIRRHELLTVLLDAVRDEPTISPQTGSRVLEVQRTGSLRTGRGDRTEETQAQLVVGADGVHSIVRRSGAFDARVSDTATRYVRGLVATADGGLQGEFWTSLGLFGAAQVTADLTYFYAALRPGPATEALDDHDVDQWRSHWVRALPASAALLDQVRQQDELLVSDVSRVDCRHWYDGRLVLVGDAAHAMAPNVGQGANSAMVDGAVLVDELLSAHDVDAGLSAYEARRRKPVRGVQQAADQMARLSNVTGRGAAALRDGVLRLLNTSPRLGRRQMRFLQQEDPLSLQHAVERIRR